jgi:signal transduction histidine kinase
VRRFATVRVRITIGAVVVVGLALAAGGVLLVVEHRARLVQDITTAARLRADDIASALDQQGLPPDLDVATADVSRAQVVDRNGFVVSSSPDLRGEPAISTLRPPVGSTRKATVENLHGRHGRFRIVAESVSVDGQPYTVYVAMNLEPAEDSAGTLAGLLAATLPVLLVFVGVVTWLVTGRALRPVEAIRSEVEAIGGGDLHRRVPATGTDDEVGRLAQTMNAMLARLEDADAAQRRFVADASHELRTPLTSIRTQLEVDLAHPEIADWEATGTGVLEDARNLQDLVTDLLALAELEAGREAPLRHAAVDLDDVVLAEIARARHATKLEIDVTRVSGAQVEGDESQLVRLVRNLLDNAVRHAATRVTVALVEGDHSALLSVANDGPSIPVDDRQRIFERFARLDDARADHSGGTGLGLAIVHEIVEHHHGTIEVVDGPGACFRVVLPACPDRA